jgi:N-methylhydantoinase A
MLSGDTPFETLQAQFEPLQAQGQNDVLAEGVVAADITLQPILDMRYQGQSYELMVPFSQNFIADFHDLHIRTYGYNQHERPIELVNLRLRAIGRLPRPVLTAAPLVESDPQAAVIDRQPVVLATGSAEVPFFAGDRLQPGHRVAGPAIIVHPDTTVFVGPADRLHMDAYHNLIIEIVPTA